jgi:hypothetical protein
VLARAVVLALTLVALVAAVAGLALAVVLTLAALVGAQAAA